MLGELYNVYLNKAKTIPGFVEGCKEDVPYDITELANNYCKARDTGDEIGKSQYISALMVRYWHMVPYLFEKTQNIRIPLEDIPGMIYEGIEKACTYRGWLDSSMEVSREERGAEKCINQCISSVKAAYFKYFNETKRKDARKTYSIEGLTEDYDDISCSSYLGNDDSYVYSLNCKDIVQLFLDKGDVFSAFVVDIISFGDVMIGSKAKRKYTDDEGVVVNITADTLNYSQARLSHNLKNIDKSYISYFVDTYEVETSLVVDMAKKIKKVSRMCLSKYLKDSLSKIKKCKEVINLYA